MCIPCQYIHSSDVIVACTMSQIAKGAAQDIGGQLVKSSVSMKMATSGPLLVSHMLVASDLNRMDTHQTTLFVLCCLQVGGVHLEMKLQR